MRPRSSSRPCPRPRPQPRLRLRPRPAPSRRAPSPGGLRGTRAGGVLSSLLALALGCTQPARPETQAQAALEALCARKSLLLSASLPELALQRCSLSQPLFELSLAHPRVTGRLDLDGRLGDVALSVLGHERVPLEPQGPGGALMAPRVLALPNLTRVLFALWARKEAGRDKRKLQALLLDGPDAGDEASLEAFAQRGEAVEPPSRWVIQLTPEGAAVTEERASGARLSSNLLCDGAVCRYARGLLPE